MSDTIKLVVFIVPLLFLLLFLSAMFSAAETAYSSISKIKIIEESKKNKKSIKLIQKHYSSFGWTISTILIVNNLVNLASSATITFLLSRLLNSSTNTTIIATVVITPIIVIFGEIIPKLFAKKYSLGYLKKIVYILEFFNWLFLPFTFLIRKIVVSTRVTHTEKEIAGIIDLAKKERILQKEEAALVKNALFFDSTKASQIMIKKEKIVFVNYKISKEELIEKFKETNFSRLVVEKNNKFIGVILLKDVLKIKGKRWLTFIKEPIKLSKNTVITKILEIIRKEKLHMIFIVENNKKQNVIGLITVEDIMEELIGEIYDEHERIKIREINLNTYYVDGSATIKEWEDITNIEMKDIDKTKTMKQWFAGKIRSKIKRGHTYRYEDIAIIKVIENSKSGRTVFEIKINK